MTRQDNFDYIKTLGAASFRTFRRAVFAPRFMMMEAGVGMITEAALPVKTGGAAFCVFISLWFTFSLQP